MYPSDKSGTLNSAEELSCLLTNLIVSMDISVDLDWIEEAIAPECKRIEAGHHLTFEQFVDFAEDLFGQLQK